MKLSKRIYALCDAVSKGESVADIGTDHGYVPMLLVKNGISEKAIMSDISASSLQKARNTFEEMDLAIDERDFRVADGLDSIEPAEVDDIIIAGLGGLTISAILNADLEKTRSFKKLIMQPRKHSGNLRYYLYTKGFDIVREQLVPEGKFICEIITAVPSECCERVSDISEEDIRWKYPAEFANLEYAHLKKRLDWKLQAIEIEIGNLQSSEADYTTLIERLQSDSEYLKKLLEECKRTNEIK